MHGDGDDGDEHDFLETARLILRPPRADDAAAIARLANNRRVVENTGRLPYPYYEEHARQWIASLPGGGGEGQADAASFVVLAREPEAHLVGAVGFGRMGEDASDPDLGYWLGEPFWGNGYATEAARAAIDFAFAERGLARLVAGCRIANGASRRVLEKCGFQYSGDAMMDSRYFGGTVPVRRFRLERGIWSSLKQWGGGGERG